MNEEEEHREPTVEALPLGPWVEQAMRFDLLSVTVEARFRRSIRLRDPACSVMRGLLGERLRHLRCLTRAPTCDGCAERARCDYARVFEDGPVGGDNDGTRAFWLRGLPVAPELAAGTSITVVLCAAGPALEVLPYLDVALRDALERLGSSEHDSRRDAPALSFSRQQRLALAAQPPSDAVRIRARTPLILRGDMDRAQAMCPAAPWLGLLLRAGVRRIDRLAAAFGPPGERVRAAFPPLEDVTVEGEGFGRYRGSRFSHKQDRRVPLSGIVGEAVVRGGRLAEMAPLLQALELTGVGKLTSMGFGELEVSPA